MKSEIIDVYNLRNLEFPKLMEYIDGELIVLFNKACYGMVIKSNELYSPVGQYRVDWVMDEFRDFGKTIKLSN